MTVHPGYWMYETSGILRPAVESFLAGGEMSAENVAAMRAYFRQWIMATVWDENPHAGAGERVWLRNMRERIDDLTSRAALKAWLFEVAEQGLDPL